VDVVLNCLTGAAIDEGLSLLAPYGRFVEVAKRDIYADRKVGLAPFRRNLSYFALDLARMLEEKPARVGETLRKVVELVDAKQLPALAMTVFDAGETAAAFRLMSAAKHVGKLAIRLDEAPSIIRSETPRELRGRGLVLVAGDSGPAGREMVR